MTDKADKTEFKPCLEQRREISEYEGRYGVSSFWRVRSWRTGGGHQLKVPHLKQIQADKDGYPYA